MNKTRLIIVEGLPGSGKSYVTSLIASELNIRGHKVISCDEGSKNHPCDYDNYDFPNFETEKLMILKKWREFVSKSFNDTIYVFNAVFLQNPMCEAMMRFGMNEEESLQYICEIAEIIREMNPLIIYIDKKDVRKVIENVISERGNDWLNAVIDYHVNGEYGKKHGLTGFDGYISCLEERKRREKKILKLSYLNSVIIEKNMTDEELLSVMHF